MRILMVAILLTATACASAGEGSARAGDVLTASEIRASSQMDADGVIRELRPRWMRVRGPVAFSGASPIMIYVNGVRRGGIEVLGSIPADTIQEMRYYGASAARARFGLDDDVQAAIAIRTR